MGDFFKFWFAQRLAGLAFFILVIFGIIFISSLGDIYYSILENRVKVIGGAIAIGFAAYFFTKGRGRRAGFRTATSSSWNARVGFFLLGALALFIIEPWLPDQYTNKLADAQSSMKSWADTDRIASLFESEPKPTFQTRSSIGATGVMAVTIDNARWRGDEVAVDLTVFNQETRESAWFLPGNVTGVDSYGNKGSMSLFSVNGFGLEPGETRETRVTLSFPPVSKSVRVNFAGNYVKTVTRD